MTPEQTFTALQCIANSRAARCAKSVVEDITLAVRTDQLTEVSTFLDPVFLDADDPAAAWDPTSKT